MNPSTRDLATPVTRLQPRPPDLDWLYRLPLWDRLDLEACETAPREARQRLAANLKKWSLQQFELSAPLVLSEIATNAVVAVNALFEAHIASGGEGARPLVTVWLGAGPSVVVLLAWDASDVPPERRPAGDDDENGRGLMIVEQLSADCGYYYPAGFGGKITWAIIDRP